MICGVLYDITAFFETVFYHRVIRFILDFVMMIFFTLLFVCVLIAYNNGAMRMMYLLASVTSFTVYLLTLHRLLFPVLKLLASPFRKFLKFLSKKLKNSKKSFKNLLHSGK